LLSTALLGLLVSFCSALDRFEVEFAVKVRDDYAVAALFALVIMDLRVSTTKIPLIVSPTYSTTFSV
jgi:hypothetical protein